MNPVVWFEIYVSDMERARKFYETVLNVSLSDLPMGEETHEGFRMCAFPMTEGGEGAAGSLVYMKDADVGGSNTIVYFNSEDCAVEEARIAGAGGEVFKSKFSIVEYGFVALAYDTEGNMFGLHSQK